MDGGNPRMLMVVTTVESRLSAVFGNDFYTRIRFILGNVHKKVHRPTCLHIPIVKTEIPVLRCNVFKTLFFCAWKLCRERGGVRLECLSHVRVKLVAHMLKRI